MQKLPQMFVHTLFLSCKCSVSPFTLLYLFSFFHLFHNLERHFETVNDPRKEGRCKSPSGNEVKLRHSSIVKLDSEVRWPIPSDNEHKLTQRLIIKVDNEVR